MIMSDEHNHLDYEFDDQGDSILDQSEDQEEQIEQGEAWQGEEAVRGLQYSSDVW